MGLCGVLRIVPRQLYRFLAYLLGDRRNWFRHCILCAPALRLELLPKSPQLGGWPYPHVLQSERHLVLYHNHLDSESNERRAYNQYYTGKELGVLLRN